jgi:hypothetical protein
LSFFFLEKSNQNSEEPTFFLSETDCFMPAIDRSHSLRRIGREDNMVEAGDRGRIVDGVPGENPNGDGAFSNLTKGNNIGGRGFASGHVADCLSQVAACRDDESERDIARASPALFRAWRPLRRREPVKGKKSALERVSR